MLGNLSFRCVWLWLQGVVDNVVVVVLGLSLIAGFGRVHVFYHVWVHVYRFCESFCGCVCGGACVQLTVGFPACVCVCMYV